MKIRVGCMKILLPSSELIVASFVLRIFGKIISQETISYGGRLLHVYTHHYLIASRIAEGATVGNGEEEV